MEPWYKIVTPRKEVREGRSFNPDEFAIALEQVVAGKAPPDYQKPEQFFARTCWTRALTDNTALVLRRLAGETANTAPVIALVTQFGGGKTHTLTALYHIFSSGKKAKGLEGIEEAMKTAEIQSLPDAKVGVFVGNAWDPAAGAETPWIALARQIAGEKGVKALGPAAKTAPPGTESLLRLYDAAGGKVLILCDEVLNFINRYRDMAEPFRLFIANLVRSMTGATGCASVISLPQSKPEMSEWDLRWQDIITKEVNRVATQLIANDESEIAVVVRRRLFQDLGQEAVRQEVAKRYAAWCFERRAQLPPECTAVESSTAATKAREILRRRFEDCYPFHPATLSVFQRKWQVLHQYQQTRGTLAMLAQWIAWAYRTGFSEARQEPLITIGSAPLDVREFAGVVLGQLGEPRLAPAIDADIAGVQSHALSLDADTKNSLRNIHRRVGTAILFECSGGQKDKVAHLPELRYALGEPNLDTTSVDTAALALERDAYFIKKVGSDGFMISHQATLKKVVHARRASLDDARDVVPSMETAVRREFERGLPAARGTAQAGASVPLVCFPEDGTSIPDTPKLTVVLVHPSNSWGGDSVRETLREWSKQRGKSPRLYPGALVFCVKKPGNELREKVELNLAWGKVASEIVEGTLGGEYDRSDRASVQARVTEAAEAVKDEVWAGYRFVVVVAEASQPLPSFDAGLLNDIKDPSTRAKLNYDRERGVISQIAPLKETEKTAILRALPEIRETLERLFSVAEQGVLDDRLRIVDLGAGHASSGETLCGRILTALKSQALLNESVGSGYIERNWPPALKASGAWPLASLRQSFLNGTLTRLLDPDTTLRARIVDAVSRKEFGLASGERPDGTYERIWFDETVGPEEVAFESGVFLLLKSKARLLKEGKVPEPPPTKKPEEKKEEPEKPTEEERGGEEAKTRTIQVKGRITPETWNRLGTKLLPKLRAAVPAGRQGTDLRLGIDFSVTVESDAVDHVVGELRQALTDLGLNNTVEVL